RRVHSKERTPSSSAQTCLKKRCMVYIHLQRSGRPNQAGASKVENRTGAFSRCARVKLTSCVEKSGIDVVDWTDILPREGDIAITIGVSDGIRKGRIRGRAGIHRVNIHVQREADRVRL